MLRTARVWVYKEQLREILERKLINVALAMFEHSFTCVIDFRVALTKECAALVRKHQQGIIPARARTGQTNGFLKVFNGLF